MKCQGHEKPPNKREPEARHPLGCSESQQEGNLPCDQAQRLRSQRLKSAATKVNEDLDKVPRGRAQWTTGTLDLKRAYEIPEDETVKELWQTKLEHGDQGGTVPFDRCNGQVFLRTKEHEKVSDLGNRRRRDGKSPTRTP